MMHAPTPIRVLVVDDSAFMRKAISTMLREAQDIVVVDTAKNGEEALQKVASLDLDVMTLDIDMPGMDGLTVLEHVMKLHPLPVVMVSALTEDGAALTIRALELGAIDFIPKHLGGSSLKISLIREPLQEKIRVAAKASSKIRSGGLQNISSQPVGRTSPCPPISLQRAKVSPPSFKGPLSLDQSDPGVLVIGCSTGGPQALQTVLASFPATFPCPIVVAQHMPKFFTKPFAERLDQLCALKVRQAEEGDQLHPGLILIAPGGQHMMLKRYGQMVTTHISEEPQELPYRPSVDLLMQSAADLYGPKVTGVVMTGMGQDGLEGARAVKHMGGSVFAQDEATCIVYGMPKAVAEQGLADKVIPLNKISSDIQAWLHRQPKQGSPDMVSAGFSASH